MQAAAGGVENAGVTLDATPGTRHDAFTDPGRIAWELYLA